MHQENELLTADCHPITVVPGLHRLFLEYCSGAAAARAFYASGFWDESWRERPAVPAHWPELVGLLTGQNVAPSPAAAAALDALSGGAGVVVTGQQVGLFGGPLFTPFKAATALARAREATAAGRPHAAIFWLATEDHDFAEINHVVFPARRELRSLTYSAAPEAARPVGGLVLDDSITPLVEQAGSCWGLPKPWTRSPALTSRDARWPRPLRSFIPGFLPLKVCWCWTPVAARRIAWAHRFCARPWSAPMNCILLWLSAIGSWKPAGYHAQVAVVPQSSLLFLIDERSGARLALKRLAPSAEEPNGLWQAGRKSYSTAELVGILDAEPERISPSALLRPVFQDILLSTSAIVGGPAEIAYFAQSAVLLRAHTGTSDAGTAAFFRHSD
jgi:hypothetical protein